VPKYFGPSSIEAPFYFLVQRILTFPNLIEMMMEARIVQPFVVALPSMWFLWFHKLLALLNKCLYCTNTFFVIFVIGILDGPRSSCAIAPSHVATFSFF